MTTIYSPKTIKELKVIANWVKLIAEELEKVDDTDKMKAFVNKCKPLVDTIEKAYPETLKLIADAEEH